LTSIVHFDGKILYKINIQFSIHTVVALHFFLAKSLYKDYMNCKQYLIEPDTANVPPITFNPNTVTSSKSVSKRL
jgi:hypothetical protein